MMGNLLDWLLQVFRGTDVRASPTATPKLPRGKLTAGLPRGRARTLLQRARENAAAPKTFAPRARLRHPARQSCRSGCHAHYLTPRAARTNRHGNFTPAPPRVARSPPRRRRPPHSPSRRTTSPADELPPRRRSSSGYLRPSRASSVSASGSSSSISPSRSATSASASSGASSSQRTSPRWRPSTPRRPRRRRQ
jgi:hypothetical protein